MDIKAAAEQIWMDNLVSSEARHSGASIDIGLGLKSLTKGQIGRWTSTMSLKLFEKFGELLLE